MQSGVKDEFAELDEKITADFLADLTAERRLRGLPVEERLRGLSPEELAAAMTKEQAARLREILEAEERLTLRQTRSVPRRSPQPASVSWVESPISFQRALGPLQQAATCAAVSVAVDYFHLPSTHFEHVLCSNIS